MIMCNKSQPQHKEYGRMMHCAHDLMILFSGAQSCFTVVEMSGMGGWWGPLAGHFVVFFRSPT